MCVCVFFVHFASYVLRACTCARVCVFIYMVNRIFIQNALKRISWYYNIMINVTTLTDTWQISLDVSVLLHMMAL